MTTRLTRTTENLYSVFKSYVIKEGLRERACDCCVTNEEIKLLLSKPLKELSYNEIGPFFRSAISTFGYVEDFKHFLPRILELMQDPNCYVLGDFLTFEKLNYSEWKNWNIDEIEAIKTYLQELLIDALNNNLDTVEDYIELNLKYINFNKLCKILANTNSKKLIDSIVEATLNSHYYKVDDRLFNFFSSQTILDKLENEFFKEKDKAYTSRISIAHNILETHQNKNK